MDDYSAVGRTKLEQQAKRDLGSIRCPLDSAMMMVMGGIVGRAEDGATTYRAVTKVPAGSRWRVASVHLECSACRRQIRDVIVDEEAFRSAAALH